MRGRRLPDAEHALVLFPGKLSSGDESRPLRVQSPESSGGRVTRARARPYRPERHPARGTVYRGHGAQSKERELSLKRTVLPPLTSRNPLREVQASPVSDAERELRPRRRFARGITVPGSWYHPRCVGDRYRRKTPDLSPVFSVFRVSVK